MIEKLKYRPEIDGLRTLAVLAVIFNHLQALRMDGGFIGVDIFFVISGYLMGSIVLREIDEERFSLKSFCLRRLKRLYPALIIVLIATTIAAYFILLPPDLEAYSNSLITSLFACSNVYFWKTTNYFSGSAEFLPLLHTWSLSVEEQFYFLFPVFSLLLFKFRIHNRLLIFSILFSASLFLSIYAARDYPVPNYFSLPTRAWEMTAGVLIAIKRPKLGSHVLLKIGVIFLLILPIFFYDKNTTFPGIMALLPVIATGLFICVDWKKGASLVDDFFMHPLTVYLGKISYPMYLWHWPLISFANHLFIEKTLVVIAAILFINVILSIITYELVEKRIKHLAINTRSSVNRFLFLTAGTTVAITIIALTFKTNDGLWNRYSGDIKKAYDRSYDNTKPSLDLSLLKPSDKAAAAENFRLVGKEGTKKKFFLVGDSHAKSFAPLISELAHEYGCSGYVILRDASTLVPNVYTESKKYNLAYYVNVFDYIKQSKVENIILISRWATYTKGNSSGQLRLLATEEGGGSVGEALHDFKKNLSILMKDLENHGKNVYIVNQVPEQEYEVPRKLAHSIAEGKTNSLLGVSYKNRQERAGDINSFINTLESEKVNVIDSDKLMFSGEYCRVQINGYAYYFDDNHLTYAGTKLFEKELRVIFIEH